MSSVIMMITELANENTKCSLNGSLNLSILGLGEKVDSNEPSFESD